MSSAISPSELDRLLKLYKKFLEKKSYRYTHQRETVVKEFLLQGGHLSAETLLRYVNKKDPRISLASIYRTLSTLVDAGLAAERRFLENTSLYEYNNPVSHHDHLICIRCGKIIEFEEERIERLQEKVAKQLGFTLLDHRLELYGLCSEKKCQESHSKKSPS